ncbi:MAG: class II fumarate hydratase [Eubacteriales bacterium]|nr:class II fumarate hydratase [Eubacteriales bacterium]
MPKNNTHVPRTPDEISAGEGMMPWGDVTRRSLRNFRIGTETMPPALIRALIQIKHAAADANAALGRLSDKKRDAIRTVCEELLAHPRPEYFPLKVWQTGSGTQTNMNVNEVIAGLAAVPLHPNDDVNKSQSSNDVMPTAIHMAVLSGITRRLLPALDGLIDTLDELAAANPTVIKTGRTHLQDAVPLRFAQEVGAWRSALMRNREMLLPAIDSLRDLAAGGTAVGTGLNTHPDYPARFIDALNAITGEHFRSDPDKFKALSMKTEVAAVHAHLKILAGDLTKIAEDVRFLSSGPRCGYGEINIPANEPGSSIMPGKVNPTQCEALLMVAAQVTGNDVTVSIAASRGNFQLNVYMPVIAYNVLQSIDLLADAVRSFDVNCCRGITVNADVMANNLARSLMTVTALNPVIGYEKGAEIVKTALRDNITVRAAALAADIIDADTFDHLTDPERAIGPSSDTTDDPRKP